MPTDPISSTTPAGVPTWPSASRRRKVVKQAPRVWTPAAWLRVHLTYWWRHRRRLSLDRPRRFTELVQRRKLVDRDPRIPQMIDKVGVKLFVAGVLGNEWVTPTLWSGEILPDKPPFPGPFVVKSRHGCRQYRVVRNAPEDWHGVRLAAAEWMQRPYGNWLDEWGYRDVPRGVLIEPFVGDGQTLPIDYKLYVFHGRVEAIQVHVDRETCHRWVIFDRDWCAMSTDADRLSVPQPTSLPLMIEGAEALGRTFEFVRVDFYDVGAVPRFGEMTFYPGSGLDRFDPPRLDDLLGDHWRQIAGTDRPIPLRSGSRLSVSTLEPEPASDRGVV